MSNLKISKITMPDGNTYDIKDANINLASTYDSSTQTVTLTAGSLEDGDEREY